MKFTKIFLFILPAFFFISISFVNAGTGSDSVTVTVTPPPVNCEGSWSACSGGSHTFTITRPAENGGAACNPAVNTTESCGTEASWSGWSACSLGSQSGTCTEASGGGAPTCAGLGYNVGTNTQSCGTAGYWSDWSGWGSCSVSSCGQTGTQGRTRYCIGPYGGGVPCVGSTTDSQSCSTAACPTGSISASNCSIAQDSNSCNSSVSWSTTSPWGTSAVTTPNSITVANANSSAGTSYPVPNPDSTRTFYLYNNSTLLGQATAIASCAVGIWYGGYCRVPVNGGWSDWSAADNSCNASGPTTRTQTRSCTNPSPAYGGADCSSLDGGNSTQTYNVVACVCANPLTDTRTLSCATGYHGQIDQSQSKDSYANGCGWLGWTTTSDTCTINSYTVSTSAGTGGYISPTGRSVNYNNSTTFTVTPDTRYSINSVSGCSGSLSGSTYTTGAITSDCTVTASFKYLSGSLTPSSSSCSIAENASSCTVNLTWSTTNPIGTSAVTASGMTDVNGNSGSQAFTVPYSSRTFYLYNNSIQLDSTSITASCTGGTSMYDVCRSPINGGWSGWSAKDNTPGYTGTQTRTCTSPTPAYGGADCSSLDGGNSTQSYTNAPSAPTGFGAAPSSCNNNWLNLWWNASSGATNYKVYRSGSLVYDSSGTSFSDSSLTLGSSYSYTITASNGGGTSGTASTSATVSNACAPTPDMKASAWGYDHSDGPMETYTGSPYTLYWNAVSNATSCNINGSDVSVSGGSQSGTASARSQTFTLSCTNVTGQSASDSVTITTPPPVTNLTNSCSGDSLTATISWTAPSGYNTFYTRTSSGYNNEGVVGTSYSFPVSPNTDYSAWVHTKNTSNGAWSNEIYTYINCARTHTLTVGKAGTGTGTVGGAGTYNYNVLATSTATADASSDFTGWSGDCNSSGQVTMNSNKVCTANFTLKTYTITASAGSNGTISPTGTTTKNYGTSQTYSISSSSSSYSISDVLVDGSSVGAVGSYTFSNITASHTISATFKQLSGSLSSSASSCVIAENASSCNVTLTWSTTNPIGTSAVTASGMTNVNGNSGNQSFAVPYSSRTFYLYNNGIELDSKAVSSSCNTPTDFWNSSICAINTYTISASAGANGTVSPSGVTSKNYGTSQAYTISPSANYHIVSVLVDGSSVGAVGSYTFSNITTNHSISATFIIDLYTLAVNKAGTGAGNVTGAGTYNYGQAVTATASPSADSTFAGWSGDCNGSGQVTMNSNKTCIATFTTVTTSVIASPTTYNTIPNTNVSFTYTPTTNSGTTECRLLDNASGALTAYQANSPIVHTPPSSAGAYGYYIQCRNTVHTTVIATSALITVTVVTVSVTASTPYNVAPNTSVSFTYTPTTNSGTTECLLLDNVLSPLTAYQLASPITHTVPNNIGSYGYYVKCRNTTTTTAMANSGLIIVNTDCSYGTPGTSWNGSACVIPSGTLTASDCKISAGESSCNSNVSWTINNPVAIPTAITASGMTDENVTNTLATPQSGIKSLPVPYPSRTFYLYNNGEPSRADDVAYATCTDTPIQTFWDESKCVTPDGNLSVSPCTVQAGNNSCDNATLDWSITNPIGNSRVDADYGTSPIVPSIANTSSGQATFSLEAYKEKTISLYSGIFKVKEMKTTAICWNKTTWNGSICELNTPKIDSFTAEPSTIFEGRASTLSWSADPDLVTSCTGTGFSTGTGSPTSGSVKVSPVVTTTYKITCGRTGSPSASSTAVVKVIVLTIKEQ